MPLINTILHVIAYFAIISFHADISLRFSSLFACLRHLLIITMLLTPYIIRFFDAARLISPRHMPAFFIILISPLIIYILSSLLLAMLLMSLMLPPLFA